MDNPESPRSGPLPDLAAAADAEWAQYTAWLDREAAAGREPEPWAPDEWEPWDPEPDEPDFSGSAPAGSALAGPAPAGPGRSLFAQDEAADVLPPCPFLGALTGQAAAGAAGLSDSEIVGALRATQWQIAREQYKQVLLAAELGRRCQAAFQDALARGVPAGCAAGGFPGEELAAELVITRGEAGHLIDDAIDLTSRLPKTLAGMAAGLIDAGKAGWIAFYTRSLNPAGTAQADEVLAADAPDLRVEQLARKADALEKKLNPEGARARRERAKRDGQRVEARREASGNASLAGRELETADVLASKAYLDAVAASLREGGVPGSLDRLRALVLTDLTQGRDPLARVNPVPASPPSVPEPAPPEHPGATRHAAQDGGPAGNPGERAGRPGGPAPVPALVNLIIPAGTLLGLSAAPAQAGAWGPLDADEARAVVTGAAAHPRTRW